jgi:hypothetical protein
VTYTIVRDVPPPTLEQLGRPPAECCPRCLNDERNTSRKLPANLKPGMEQLAELDIGDALDGPRVGRNRFGLAYRAYDYLNDTKHEIYMISHDVVRVRRIK